MISKFNLFFLTMFKIGNIKYAPGTIASLVTCILFIILIYIINITVILFCTIIIFSYSFFAINSSYEKFKTDDPQEIVIDEVVGQMIPLIAIPIYETLYPLPQIYYCFFCFLFFRFFDIFKPYPIRLVDKKMKSGLGIVLDDILAGLFTLIVILLFFWGVNF